MSLAGMSEHPDFHEKAGSGTLDEEASTTSHQVPIASTRSPAGLVQLTRLTSKLLSKLSFIGQKAIAVWHIISERYVADV